MSGDVLERYVESMEDDLLPDDVTLLDQDAGAGRSWGDVVKRHGFRNVAEYKAVVQKVEAQQGKLPPKMQERIKAAKARKKAATTSPPR